MPQQLLIGSSKNEEKLGHLNFASQLLPSLNINAQNKVPLNKFLVLNPLCFLSCLTKILLHKYLIPR
jgi:hypothetical protein